QNFGFTGLDAVAFQNEVNDSGLNCALNLDVSSFSVANGQSDSAEAIYLFAQSSASINAQINQSTAQNIKQTVLRASAIDSGSVQISLDDVNFSDFDSAGIYLENYVFWPEVSDTRGVQAKVSNSTLTPNPNGRAFLVNHQGNAPTNIEFTGNRVGSSGTASDGFSVYDAGLGKLSATIDNNPFLSSGASDPNLPSNLSHRPFSTIYFENMTPGSNACFSATNNTSVAAYNFALSEFAPAIYVKAGPSATIEIDGWNGSGGKAGADSFLTAANPEASLGVNLETLNGGTFSSGSCELPSASVISTSATASQHKISGRSQLDDQAINIPVIPPGKSVHVFFDAIVNDLANQSGYVSAQGMYTLGDSAEVYTTTDPNPISSAPNNGRTYTELFIIEPTLEFNNQSLSEETGSLSVQLTLSEPSNRPIELELTSEDGTATAGSDYTAISETILFPAGVTSAAFEIQVSEDTIIEGDETFTISFTASSGSVVILASMLVTIIDSTAAPTIPELIPPDLIVEESTGDAVLQLSLTEVATEEIEVNYTTVSGSAAAGSDFLDGSGTIVFAAGTSQQSVTINIIDDVQTEEDEIFFVEYSAMDDTQIDITDNQSQITILANDQTTINPDLLVSDLTANEADEVASITLQLSEASNMPITIFFAPQAGTAAANSDFVPLAGEVTFPPSIVEATIEIQLVNDQLVEETEVFTVMFEASPTSVVQIPTPEITVTIEDDDVAPALLALSAPDVQVSEGDSIATVTVNLSRAATDPISVAFETFEGSALAPEDYTNSSGIIQFPVGSSSATEQRSP
ncbi:MAG: Calx-beta domain-containing protein, partial [Chloroflexota bacterium]